LQEEQHAAGGEQLVDWRGAEQWGDGQQVEDKAQYADAGSA
jgi:hypothetical protein